MFFVFVIIKTLIKGCRIKLCSNTYIMEQVGVASYMRANVANMKDWEYQLNNGFMVDVEESLKLDWNL